MKKLLIYISIFVIIGIFGGFIYLKNYSWRRISNTEEMTFNGNVMNNEPSLPDNFYKVYDKIYPGHREYTMNSQLLSEFISGVTGHRKIHDCKCDEIGYMAWDNENVNLKFNFNQLLGNYRTFGYGLEKYSSPQKCFDFWINHDISWKGKYLNSLEDLSKSLYKKSIKEMSDDEIIKLIVWRQLQERAWRDTTEFSDRFNNLTEKYNK